MPRERISPPGAEMSDRRARQTGAMATPRDDGSWEVQGRRVEFPVRVADATAACATYLVRTARAARLVDGTGLELVSLAGRTPLFLVLVDYADGDLGDYEEVAVALLVRYRGRTGMYIRQLPVTQTFTMEAGGALWGLPKWLARAELSITGPAATCHLADATGHHVLTAALRALPWRIPLRVRGALTTLAPREHDVLASPVRGRVAGIRLGPAGATVVLGSGHPMSDELRAVGLPRRPVATLVAEHVVFEMGRARALAR